MEKPHLNFKATSLQPKDLLEQAGCVLEALRSTQPHVHCLTNPVAQTFTANALLALGVQPSMSVAPEEIADFITNADAALINLGMPDEQRMQSYEIAAKAARQSDKPFVLDPVFVERSPRRLELARQLLRHSPIVLRGNPRELSALSCGDATTVLVETGSQDQIKYQGWHVRIGNGSAFMSASTAFGCAVSAVIAAALAVNQNAFIAATAGVLIFAVCGQLAAQTANGPGSFVPTFLDQLFNMSADDILRHGDIS